MNVLSELIIATNTLLAKMRKAVTPAHAMMVTAELDCSAGMKTNA